MHYKVEKSNRTKAWKRKKFPKNAYQIYVK